MFNFFKKSISKEEENKVTITKIEIMKYKKLIKAIVGNRGDTLYKFIDEYNKRNLKNLDVEIRSTILKYNKYDTPEEFEIDLFNTSFKDLTLMYMETKGYVLSIDWKGEDEENELVNFINKTLHAKGEEKIRFEELEKLEKRIKEEKICVYSSDFLMIKFKLIDNSLKKIGYTLYFINDESDTYHVFPGKEGIITEDEKIINFWTTDLDDYEHNGLGRDIKAGISKHKMMVHLNENESREIPENTIFFINDENNTDLDIETINCEEISKGKVVKDNLYYEKIC